MTGKHPASTRLVWDSKRRGTYMRPETRARKLAEAAEAERRWRERCAGQVFSGHPDAPATLIAWPDGLEPRP